MQLGGSRQEFVGGGWGGAAAYIVRSYQHRNTSSTVDVDDLERQINSQKIVGLSNDWRLCPHGRTLDPFLYKAQVLDATSSGLV